MSTSVVIRFIERLRPFLSLRPFDVSTAEGRARERQRRAALSTVAAMFAKVVSVGTQLITIPLTLNYLGAERFGLWMTISSVVAMLAFADLGIGNGLLNAIAEANGKDDSEAIRRYISSATLILGLVSCSALGVLGLLHSLIPWAKFFNVTSPLAVAEAGPATTMFLTCFALNVPATIVQRIQLGLQMGFVANLWQGASSLSALVAVLTCVHLKLGLPWLVLAFAGAPILAAAANAFVFFLRTRPDLLPRLDLVTRYGIKRVMHSGLLFLTLQVVVAVTYLSDSLIIARILGAREVAVYAVPDKMFSVIPLMLSMMLIPLWPAYAEAISRGDGQWVLKILKISVGFTVAIAGTASLIFVTFGPNIIRLWVGHDVLLPPFLLAAFGIWKVLEGLGNAVSMFLNGANVVGMQVKISLFTAAAAIVLKLILIRSIGISGVLIATIICYTSLALVPYAFSIKKITTSRLITHRA